MAAARVGVDVDRHDACRAIGLGWQHLEVGEVLRVIERELGAQYLGEVEGVALVVAQVAAHQGLVDHLLLDRSRPEAIALAGVELERHVGAVVGRIDHELVADQSRIEIAVGGGGALQFGLDALVVRVFQPLSFAQRQMPEDPLKQRVGLAGAVDPHVHVPDEHRLTRSDADVDAPVVVAEVGDRRLDLWLVVAEGLEGRLHFALHAVVQPLDRVGVEVRAALAVALEAQVSEHVGAQLLVDAPDLHLDACGMGELAGDETHGNCRGPPVPSTSPRQGFVLRHLTVRSGTWSRRILEPRGNSRSSPLVIQSPRAPRRFRGLPHGHSPGFRLNSVSPTTSPRESKRRSAR